ncbi:sialate O-acetylesterase [Pseudozobellia sp. WGM2]|uniref:sialate O-acetylesterase n=1 Tax=Pseudozobellia sp. WGM2 TaxID=2787625 RepID=UPI001AE08404|nr:sialate O-acetylesterase [Pseudozobellia sp. WGM2]
MLEKNTSKIKLLAVSVLALVTYSICLGQELKPAAIFSDHMVLQRDVPIPVWGAAKPNESITVTLNGETAFTTSDSEGKWKVELAPLKAAKESLVMTIMGSSKIVFKDVVVGEVWICSGQSNMQFATAQVPELEALLLETKNIRSFEVKRTVSFKEEENVIGNWQAVPPKSAVAFGFAYFLEDVTDIPIGIIHTSWGSSSLEAWMPRKMEDELPYFKELMRDFDADTITKARIKKALNSKEGWTNKEDIFMRRQPNILFNAMMKPIAPYACRGLVWYQGERNTRYLSGVPEVDDENWFHRVIGMKEYGEVLKLWIQNYRDLWQNDQMHFSIVMLPGYGKGIHRKPKIDFESPTEPSWAWMRESQMKVLELAHANIANTIDLGDAKNIHPKDKLPIGQRLALLARKYTLNEPIVADGPKFENVEIKNNRLVVHFKNAEYLKTTDGNSPQGFWISANEINWKKANAKIIGTSVALQARNIKKPKYVRYAFAGKPVVNLVNEANLPAYPFRTDENDIEF